MKSNNQLFTSGNNSSNALIVFVRYPESGKVKTRLAAETGNEFACNTYRIFCIHLFNKINELKNFDTYLYYADADDELKVAEWTDNKFFYAAQRGNDLGERMANSFIDVLVAHKYEKAIIIGTDIPDITTELIYNSEQLLDENDLVIGPSKDGGYYLLGIKKYYPELFRGILWSSDNVFESTMKISENLNLKKSILPFLLDIDMYDDIKHWLNSNGNDQIKKEIFGLINQMQNNNYQNK